MYNQWSTIIIIVIIIFLISRVNLVKIYCSTIIMNKHGDETSNNNIIFKI